MKGEKMENVIRGVCMILGTIIVLFLTKDITHYKLDYYKGQDRYLETTSTKVIEQRLNCMTQNIYREAGYEPFEGKVAVAQVTLNRVNDPRFPKDICAVVYQKNIIMEKVVCQFSWYCMDSINKTKALNNAAYKESYEVAKKVMLEGFRLDGVKHALYYHADYINPNWKLRKVAKIGNHIFYEDNNRKD
jgi:spore germination cell wall hydrolase CwlJ-like protein